MTYLKDEAATLSFAKSLLPQLKNARVVTLKGDLGAGKTTLVRGILKAMGYQGHVKSPTYGLVETYELDNRTVAHFDLYRLADPEELEYIGFSDYLQANTLCLIEWPDKGGNRLGNIDLCITISVKTPGREITISLAHEESVLSS